eukprot:2607-Heterococcus_DN1.PRE.12
MVVHTSRDRKPSPLCSHCATGSGVMANTSCRYSTASQPTYSRASSASSSASRVHIVASRMQSERQWPRQAHEPCSISKRSSTKPRSSLAER